MALSSPMKPVTPKMISKAMPGVMVSFPEPGQGASFARLHPARLWAEQGEPGARPVSGGGPEVQVQCPTVEFGHVLLLVDDARLRSRCRSCPSWTEEDPPHWGRHCRTWRARWGQSPAQPDRGRNWKWEKKKMIDFEFLHCSSWLKIFEILQNLFASEAFGKFARKSRNLYMLHRMILRTTRNLTNHVKYPFVGRIMIF